MTTQPITEHWYITGTSSGLGKAIAEKVLLRDGAFVYGFARKKTIQHARYHHQYIDLADVQTVYQITFEQPVTIPHHIVLINNAGTLGAINYTGSLNDSTIVDTYHLNIITPHILSNKFLQAFGHYANINKCIINVTSGAAASAYDGWSMYCASKAALDMLTLTLAVEQGLLPAEIATRVHALAPGVMDTAMQQQIRNSAFETFSKKDKFVELHKNQQLYNVHDVAARYINLAINNNSAPETIQRVIL